MLKFVGKEKRVIGVRGVPARDISEEEFEQNKNRWATMLKCDPNDLARLLVQGGAYKFADDSGDIIAGESIAALEEAWAPKEETEEPCTPCEKKKRKKKEVKDGTI